jgi:hypothetical protein
VCGSARGCGDKGWFAGLLRAAGEHRVRRDKPA